MPDAAAGGIFDLVSGDDGPPPSVTYLDRFPYLDHPKSGYDVQPLSVAAS